MFRYYFNFVEIFLANWLKNGHLSAAKTLCKNVQQQLSFLNSIFFRHMSLFSCGLICKIEEAENKFVFLVYEFEYLCSMTFHSSKLLLNQGIWGSSNSSDSYCLLTIVRLTFWSQNIRFYKEIGAIFGSGSLNSIEYRFKQRVFK